MKSSAKTVARSSGLRALVSLGTLLTATALASACGGDGDGGEDGDGGADGTSASGGKGNGGALNLGGSNKIMGDGGESEGGDCGESPFAAEALPVHMLLVIDKSNSMNTNIAPDVSRWAAMEDAINAAVASTSESVGYGLLMYPSDASCGVSSGVDVPILTGADVADNIASALADATPDGSTPTAAALAAALAYFDEGGAGADLEGNKYVLLATDGGPNCNADLTCAEAKCTSNIEQAAYTGNGDGPYPVCKPEADGGIGNCCTGGASVDCLDDDATVAAVNALTAKGVKTIVVGIPGTEAYAALLDAVADEGKAPNPEAPPSYYAVEGGSATGLTEVLGSITMGLITSCEFQLGSVPPAKNLLNVEVDETKVPRDPDKLEGWYLDESTSPPTVVLVGETCEKVKREGAHAVSVTFGCKTYEVPK
ncbi:MAG TPA: VWA domain-containing protein [Reyranella sp.]|nr:VWA domain-containing protein [Reyranella sp.]